MTPGPLSPETPQRPVRIAEVLETVARLRLAGEDLSDAAVVALHADLLPELAGELGELSLVERARRMAGESHLPSHTSARDVIRDGTRPSASTDPFPGYEILAEIERGAQGTVYRAVQRATGRQVAIKQLHEFSLAGARARPRFEREVQILAQIDHPNVVTIHDSSSAAGRFYYVMDYVEGLPLDRWISNLQSPISDSRSADKDPRRGSRRRARIENPRSEIDNLLRLFATICEAVNAAHLRGVIHRDLKPSNILIDARGEPQVLDFGLAKLASGMDAQGGAAERMPVGTTGRRDLTLTGQFVGSLPWSSPEQVQGDADSVDLRSDVYSLGIILYYMLTESFPYGVAGNVRDISDNILRAEPIRPSTIRRQIDDELETIVLKALSKDRERRYQTAGELARDVRRYLGGEPIEAKRDSGWYVFRKTVQRHRLPVGVVGLFVVILAASSVALTLLYNRAESQAEHARSEGENARQALTLADERRTRAEKQTARAESIQGFLADTLGAADPRYGSSAQVTVLEALAQAAARASQRLADQPEVEAEVRAVIGRIYSNMSRYVEAEPQLHAALALYRRTLGDDHYDTLTCMNELALLLRAENKLDEAEPLYEEAIERGRRTLGEDDPATLLWKSNLARLYASRGKLAEAESLLRETLTARRRVSGDRDRDTLITVNNLALLLRDEGRLDEAEPLAREAAEVGSAVLGEDRPDTLIWLNNLAGLLDMQGRADEAEPLYRDVLERRRKVLGEEHTNTLTSMNNLAWALMQRGECVEAEDLFRRALEAQQRVLGPLHPNTLLSMQNLGWCRSRCGRVQEGETLLREVIELRVQAQGPEHPDTLSNRGVLARLLLDSSRAAEAEVEFRELMEIAQRVLPPAHVYRAGFEGGLGECLLAQQQYGGAEAHLVPALDALRSKLGDRSQTTRRTLSSLIELYQQLGKAEQAERYRALLSGEGAPLSP